MFKGTSSAVVLGGGKATLSVLSYGHYKRRGFILSAANFQISIS
ncbi:hypothetical protein SBA5_200025 [Candidatus Sulfotelmatomonas gaucii]|uniref:Uncharacterized protein n=1 Tax=Candidatus Sulfuritelmatomonas gaucii TaxID=2043161 RepID=A0A2N9L7K3_9BACT|nr:hypothetical protein SBA5_200025 [Candidatus Sulfotelmatomonas gaucii]